MKSITNREITRMKKEVSGLGYGKGELKSLRDSYVKAGLDAGTAWHRAFDDLQSEGSKVSEGGGRLESDDRALTATERVVVQWVFDNMHNGRVREQDAPSSGAWGLLTECREDSTTRRNFYTGIWPKLLPSKSELEKESQFTDDNRDLESHLEELSEWQT